MTLQEKMGLKIKSLREQKKMSQTELAKMVGYKDKTAIAKVEAGKVDLPQSKVVAFSKALDTTISFFFDDSESIQPIATEQLHVNTIAAHFEGDDYTEIELDEIKKFAEFVKSRRK